MNGSSPASQSRKRLRSRARCGPRRLDDYIGQDRVKENLRIAIAAAQKRGEPLDHVLLYGPPGLGKTTLASIIASEMGAQVQITSGPAMDKAIWRRR